MKLRLVTLNAGLLDILYHKVAPAPHVKERLKLLPAQLLSLQPQVVALQEIYREEDRRFVLSRLQEALPYSAYVRRRPLLGLENSLMVCSAMPLEYRFERFKSGTIDERLLGQYGFIVCRIRARDGGIWSLLNVHTTAGGLWRHPESPPVDLIRSRQIRQLLGAAEAEPGISIISGDLNAGPRVSEANFCQVEEAGFASVHDLLHGRDSGSTWDPLNPLNRDGPHKLCPPQRIDHVFVRSRDLAAHRIVPLSSTICFLDPIVPVGSGYVTISDHYGLSVEFELNPTAH
jgi:endonuclease/exonuclease/phosphatase family metal-dependent hydrolase